MGKRITSFIVLTVLILPKLSFAKAVPVPAAGHVNSTTSLEALLGVAPFGAHQIAFLDFTEKYIQKLTVKPLFSVRAWVTAYSSTPEETDDTPFITASGRTVRDGIIALNFLPFGTRVQIPELFGERVFIVEDRMHARKKNFVDIWMPTKRDAKDFGINRAEIVIVGDQPEHLYPALERAEERTLDIASK